MAQLININSTEFRRCNLSAIQSGGTWASIALDENEIILISTTNALTADGSGECDAYIIGDGTTVASALELKRLTAQEITDGDERPVSSNAVSRMKTEILGGTLETNIEIESNTDGKYVYKTDMSVISSTAGMSFCVFPLHIGYSYSIHVPKAGNSACMILAYGTSASQTHSLVAVNGDIGNNAEYNAEFVASEQYLYVTYFPSYGLPVLTETTLVEPAFFTEERGSNLETTIDEISEVKISPNLFDKESMVRGYINSSSGAFTSHSGNYWASPLISVLPNHYYMLIGRNQTLSNAIRAVDSGGNSIKVLSAGAHTELSSFGFPQNNGSGTTTNGQFYTPTTAVKVQFNVVWNGNGDGDAVMLIDLGTEYNPNPDTPSYQEFGNKYIIREEAIPSNAFQISDLSIRIFGGSVSRLCETFGGCEVMRKMLNSSILDSGIDGAGFAKGTTISGGVPSFAANSIPDQVNQATSAGQKQYDIYILWASTNDTSVDVGDAHDYTYFDNYDVSKLITQNGGMNYCIKKLLDFSPTSRILVIGSMKYFNDGADFETKIKLLHDGQMEVASLNSLPFFSLWDNAGVNFANKDEYFTWTTENEGSERNDGAHPNKWAYTKIIAPMLAKFIANYCPNNSQSN